MSQSGGCTVDQTNENRHASARFRSFAGEHASGRPYGDEWAGPAGHVRATSATIDDRVHFARCSVSVPGKTAKLLHRNDAVSTGAIRSPMPGRSDKSRPYSRCGTRGDDDQSVGFPCRLPPLPASDSKPIQRSNAYHRPASNGFFNAVQARSPTPVSLRTIKRRHSSME